VYRGIDHREIEAASGIEEVNIHVVNLLVCAKAFCVNDSTVNVSQLNIRAVGVLTVDLSGSFEYLGRMDPFALGVEIPRSKVGHTPFGFPVDRDNIWLYKKGSERRGRT
jgi:hypothetical protein